MSVILTSFRVSDRILCAFPKTVPYSVARSQPKGYVYEKLSCLEPVTSDLYSKPLTLTSVNGSLERYKKEYIKKLASHDKWLKSWLKSLDNETDIMLCCWCPHSRSTQRQLKEYNTFACHTSLIGKLVNKYRPDVELWLDWEHHVFLVPEWKPKNYRIMDVC